MSLLWHPHQKLWNWQLLRALERLLPSFAYKVAARGILAVDTTLLAARALWHRLGVKSVDALMQAPIYYFDLGTHEAGNELRHMVESVLPNFGTPWHAFGFEASEGFYKKALKNFAGQPVVLVHGAVCHRASGSGTVRLYTTEDGLDDSLYRPELKDFEDVPTIQLSTWMHEQAIDPERSVLLVRMNIEGAERDVIADLREAGLLPYVDGWFGMWDDLSKIDPAADDLFRAELHSDGIRPVTFNGRDMAWPSRVRAIDAEIRTAVLRGMRRLGTH